MPDDNLKRICITCAHSRYSSAWTCHCLHPASKPEYDYVDGTYEYKRCREARELCKGDWWEPEPVVHKEEDKQPSLLRRFCNSIKITLHS